MGATINRESLQASGIGAFFRPRDIKPLGVSFRQLQSLVSKGVFEDLGSGLYRLSEVEPTELETIAMVASAVPNAIVCLLTALRIHEIGTQSPHEVWIALDRKSRKPTRLPAKVRIVRFSGAMLTYGVIRRTNARSSGFDHFAGENCRRLLPLPEQSRDRRCDGSAA